LAKARGYSGAVRFFVFVEFLRFLSGDWHPVLPGTIFLVDTSGGFAGPRFDERRRLDTNAVILSAAKNLSF
jgi:hypothetical protein